MTSIIGVIASRGFSVLRRLAFRIGTLPVACFRGRVVRSDLAPE
jgi:hypothetical protein